ncbi:1,4-dihydroxy-2-naphthoate octaprenyltransferase [Ktedonobacteria bacterium brp13]|nr:1,4-dihydroxy-2-naphthoate octaprenyltransferase [Ktedonobacteria bacterium brp13]
MDNENENENMLKQDTLQQPEDHEEQSALKTQDTSVATADDPEAETPYESDDPEAETPYESNDPEAETPYESNDPEAETPYESNDVTIPQGSEEPLSSVEEPEAVDDETATYTPQSQIVEANTVDSLPSNDVADKKHHSAQVVRADSVPAEEVPTIPIGSLQTIHALEPEVSVHSVASMRETSIHAPLVAQPAEYRRGLGEWVDIWRDGMRLKYVPLSLLPVLLGTALAWMQAVLRQHHLVQLNILHFVGIIIAVILMQVGANLINDYYDHQRGIDTSNALGPGGLIQQGFARPLNILIPGLVLLGLGTVIGLIFAIAGGILACLAVIVIALLGYFFSGSKWPLSSLGLSELIGFLAFGPLPVIVAYLIQTRGVYANSALLYSLPLGFLGAAVIYANNLRDYEGDKHANKKTLATLLGIVPGRIIYTLLLLASFAVIILCGVPHGTPHLILIALWTLPTLALAISGILRTKIAASFQDVLKQTLKMQIFLSIYLIIGLVATAILSLLPHLPAIKIPFL